MPRRSPDLLDLLLGSIEGAARAADPDLACRVLRSALDALVPAEAACLDGLGAPRVPSLRGAAPPWDSLRAEAKAYVAAVGLAEAARRYGVEPASLSQMIGRREPPGPGRKARLLQLVRN
jgi:hypothetical protein